MHSLSILIIVLTKAVPAPPALIYAYCSRLNFAMLRVAMLKGVPGEFSVLGVFENFCRKFGQFCIKWLG